MRRRALPSGIESEMELAFAGLQQLCGSFVDRIDRLPGPQRDALGTAFGLRGGDAPDRFLVGLAVLSLLSDAAEERPLLCLMDDAQWLDGASAQALSFVARRLGAESLGLVFAVRDPPGEPHLDGLAQLVIGGLHDADAQALLDAVLAGPIDERVRDRIVAETHGNPLALLELPRGRTPDELAGGFGVDGGPTLSGRIEDRFQQRLAELPPATRLLLLVAAAEPVGDSLLLWKAAAALGIDPAAGGPAAGADLVELGPQVRFRHPLVRSAVYRAAAPEDRRRVHEALAGATDPDVDPDRRAWHRARATPGLDEDVAAELERSAGRAQARGGLAAGAVFQQRAAELTPEPGLRARRALAAAQSKHQAGAPEAALRLLGLAEAGPLDELDRARAQLLHAQITFTTTRGRDAPPLLLEAAKRLEPLDAALARATYLDAFAAALSADRLVLGGDARDVAAAVLAADWGPSSHESPLACNLLLDGLAADHHGGLHRRRTGAEGRAARVPGRGARPRRTSCTGCGWPATSPAPSATTRPGTSSPRVRSSSRAAPARSPCSPWPSTTAIHVDLFGGRLTTAVSLAAEARAVVEATGSRLTLRGPIALANWQGQEAEAVKLMEGRREEVLDRGEGLWLTATDWGNAVRYNGLGRYDDALEAAERAAEDPRGLGTPIWLLTDLIEAAVRSGKPERAAGSARAADGGRRGQRHRLGARRRRPQPRRC